MRNGEACAGRADGPVRGPADAPLPCARTRAAPEQGRASHAYQLMCLFPSFAKKYQKLYEMLMYGDGPLPYDWRVYVAIMVLVLRSTR